MTQTHSTPDVYAMLTAKLAETLHIFYDVTAQTALGSCVKLTSKPGVVISGSDVSYFHPFTTQRGQHEPLPEKITAFVGETSHVAVASWAPNPRVSHESCFFFPHPHSNKPRPRALGLADN